MVPLCNSLLKVNARSGSNGSLQAPQMIGACSSVVRETRSLRPHSHEQASRLCAKVAEPSCRSVWRHNPSAASRPASWGA
jgi:hypothetical protein